MIFLLLLCLPWIATSATSGQVTNSSLAALMLQGDEALKATNLNQAREAFQKAATLYPKSKEAQAGLAKCLYEAKEYGLASDCLRAAIALGATNWKTHCLLGVCQYHLKAYPEAIDALKKSLAISSTNVVPLRWLGSAYTKAGRYGDAVGVFQKALQLVPGDYETQYRLSKALYSERQFEDALAGFETLMQMPTPENIEMYGITKADAYRGLAGCRYWLKDFDAAIEAYRQCVTLAPKDFYAWHWLGRACYEAKHYGQAVDAFKTALQIKPGDTDAHYWRGLALCILKRYPEAVKELQTYVAAKPGFFEGQYWLGSALYNSDRYAEAVSAFQSALKINPENDYAQYWLGVSLHFNKQYQPAVVALEKATKMYPEGYAGHYWLGHACWQLGKHEEAVSEFQTAAAIKPKDFGAHFYAGLVLLRLQRFPEALVELEKAHDLKPEHRAAKIELFLARLLTTQYRKAAELYPRIFALAAGGLGISYTCGLCVLLWLSLKRRAAPAPGFVFCLAWLFLFFEGQAAGALVVGCFLPAYKMAVSLNAALWACALPVAFAAVVGFARQPWGEPFARSIQFPPLKTIGLCVLGAFSVILISGSYEKLLQWLTGHPTASQSIVPWMKEALTDAPFLTAIAAVILAPVAEEILFRGLFYGALVHRVKTGWAIVITSVLFALVHLQVVYFVPLFAMGVVLGWARHKSGSLMALILIHSLNNGFALLVLKFSSGD